MLQLQIEVDRLRQALVDQAERMRKERKEAEENAWGHFREELQRVADHENASKVLPGLASQSELETQVGLCTVFSTANLFLQVFYQNLILSHVFNILKFYLCCF
jgi:hypothetical protein